MRRLLLSVLCITIVAAFQMQVAAADVVSEDVPVTGGTAALAQAAGLSVAPDRARFVAEIARVLYSIADGHSLLLAAFARQLQTERTRAADQGRAPESAVDVDVVPVPLTAAIWSAAVFHRRVPAGELVSAILADRQAALLCYGLAALDDPTLAFFVQHPDAITRVYENDAAAFGAFADSLHIHDGHVVTPGGDAAVPLWEAAIGEKVTRPER
ncbi:MAG TPA: hypothetical protein VG222_07915, partial [Vicinamibacterales bacterium]|nr:hypothetical protein [Vicinamibacterales bacterium]